MGREFQFAAYKSQATAQDQIVSKRGIVTVGETALDPVQVRGEKPLALFGDAPVAPVRMLGLQSDGDVGQKGSLCALPPDERCRHQIRARKKEPVFREMGQVAADGFEDDDAVAGAQLAAVPKLVAVDAHPRRRLVDDVRQLIRDVRQQEHGDALLPGGREAIAVVRAGHDLDIGSPRKQVLEVRDVVEYFFDGDERCMDRGSTHDADIGILAGRRDASHLDTALGILREVPGRPQSQDANQSLGVQAVRALELLAVRLRRCRGRGQKQQD
jgi:hypothetical protein